MLTFLSSSSEEEENANVGVRNVNAEVNNVNLEMRNVKFELRNVNFKLGEMLSLKKCQLGTKKYLASIGKRQYRSIILFAFKNKFTFVVNPDRHVINISYK